MSYRLSERYRQVLGGGYYTKGATVMGYAVPESPDFIEYYQFKHSGGDTLIEAYEKDTPTGISGSMVGELLVGKFPGNADPIEWFVSTILVDPAYRGRGVAVGMWGAFHFFRPDDIVIHTGSGMSGSAKNLYPSLKRRWPNNHFYDDTRTSKLASIPTTLWRGLLLGLVPHDEFDTIKNNPGAELQRAMGGYQNVGIHWTDDPTSAENFAQDRDPDGWAHEGDPFDEDEGMMVGFVLEAEVADTDIIDPESEEAEDFRSSDSILDYGIERERTVRPDSPITIVKAYMVWSDGYGDDPGGMITIPMTIRTTATEG
jgi:GNAT superfamily N-acetyltransferase